MKSALTYLGAGREVFVTPHQLAHPMVQRRSPAQRHQGDIELMRAQHTNNSSHAHLLPGGRLCRGERETQLGLGEGGGEGRIHDHVAGLAVQKRVIVHAEDSAAL